MLKRAMILFLCAVCILSAGCNSNSEEPSSSAAESADTVSESGETENISEITTEAMTAEETSMALETESASSLIIPSVPASGELDGTVPVSGEILEFGNVSSVRITYNENQSSVVYITSPEQLRSYDVKELEAYDEAFFAEKALILVKESVNSGSTKVGIQAICQNDSVISVILSHEAAEIGTTDMATWLIWAEVDKGLENCRWEVANPALKPNQEIK